MENREARDGLCIVGGKEGGRVVTWIVMPLGIPVVKSPRVTSVGLSGISE